MLLLNVTPCCRSLRGFPPRLKETGTSTADLCLRGLGGQSDETQESKCDVNFKLFKLALFMKVFVFEKQKLYSGSSRIFFKKSLKS